MVGTAIVSPHRNGGFNNQGLPTWSRAYLDDRHGDAACGGDYRSLADLYNLTGDTHPIHFHLVNVQVIGSGFMPPYAGRFRQYLYSVSHLPTKWY